MQIKTKDEVVRRVLAKMDKRSLVGQEKYGAVSYTHLTLPTNREV